MMKKQSQFLSAGILLFMLLSLLPFAVFAAEELTPEYVTGNAQGIITDKIMLPDETLSGAKITSWGSESPQRLFVSGCEAFPLAGDEDETVSLSANYETAQGAETASVDVVVPKVQVAMFPLVEQDFESTPIGELPVEQNGTWTRGGATELHNKAIGVAEDSTGNKVMAINNVGLGTSTGDNLFSYLTVNTSSYNTVEIEYDAAIYQGASSTWYAAGNSFNKDTIIRTWYSLNAAGQAVLQVQGEKSASDTSTSFTLAEKKNHIKTILHQPDAAVGTIEVSVNGGEMKTLKNNKLWIAGAKFSTIPFGTLRGTEINIEIDNLVIRVEQDPRIGLGKALESIQINGLDNISGDLVLPNESAAGGLPVIWYSSNPEVIGNDGKVSQTTSAADVTLYALVNNEGTWACKAFDAHVAPIWEGGLNLDLITGNSTGMVADKIELPETTLTGFRVERWISSNMERLLVVGNTAYPLAGSEAAAVTLTPVLDETFTGEARSFNVTVPERNERWENFVNEDFESTAPGGLPADTERAYWAGAVNDENGFVGVVYDEDTKSNALRVAHYKALNDKTYEADAFCDLSEYDWVVLEYDFNVKTGVANSWPSPGALGNGSTATVRCTQGIDKVSVQGSVAKEYTANYSPGWHRMKLVFNQETLLFSAYLDDTPVVENIQARNTSIGNGVFGILKQNAGDFLIDNYTIRTDVASARRANFFLETVNLGDLSAVQNDLVLPEKTPYGEVEIEWLSSNPDVISADGTVTRPPETGKDEEVSLYAVIRYENNWVAKKIDATVLRHLDNQEAVDKDIQEVTIPNKALCVDDLQLQKEGSWGSSIVWTSSNPAVINPDTGVVTLPAYNGGQITEVTLTAKAVSGDKESAPVSFTLRVPDDNLALRGTLTASSATVDGWAERAVDYDEATAWKMETTDSQKTFDVAFPDLVKLNYVTLKGSKEAELLSSTNGRDFTSLGFGTSFTFAAREVKYIRIRFTGREASISEIGLYLALSDDQSVKLDAEGIQIPESTSADIEIPEILSLIHI